MVFGELSNNTLYLPPSYATHDVSALCIVHYLIQQRFVEDLPCTRPCAGLWVDSRMRQSSAHRNSPPAGGTHIYTNSYGPVWNVVWSMEVEEEDRAGFQRQTWTDLEGQAEDGQMKKGTAWAAALGYRDDDTSGKHERLCRVSDEETSAVRYQKYSCKGCHPWQVFSLFWACFPILWTKIPSSPNI